MRADDASLVRAWRGAADSEPGGACLDCGERVVQVREQLAALYEAPAPLRPESVERIREILDDIGIRELREREISSHRSRALPVLRGIGEMAAAREARGLLELLVGTTTGVAEAAAA